MSKENCDICGKTFGFFRWRHGCSECDQIVCSDCYSEPKFLGRRVCDKCYDEITRKNNAIIVVKSNHVGGHNIIREITSISSGWYRNPEQAIEYLKYLCWQNDGNAILSLRVDKSTSDEPSENGKGTHYFSIFNANGFVSVIEKKHLAKNRSSKDKSSVADEIAKLTELKQRGILTEEDFQKAKRKLLD